MKRTYTVSEAEAQLNALTRKLVEATTSPACWISLFTIVRVKPYPPQLHIPTLRTIGIQTHQVLVDEVTRFFESAGLAVQVSNIEETINHPLELLIDQAQGVIDNIGQECEWTKSVQAYFNPDEGVTPTYHIVPDLQPVHLKLERASEVGFNAISHERHDEKAMKWKPKHQTTWQDLDSDSDDDSNNTSEEFAGRTIAVVHNVNISKFNGRASTSQAKAWIREFITNANLYSWDFRQRLTAFVKELEGPASNWYRQLPKDQRQDWRLLEAQFRSRY